jgi:hypothetical protein
MVSNKKYLKLHGIDVEQATKAQKIYLQFLLAGEVGALLFVLY